MNSRDYKFLAWVTAKVKEKRRVCVVDHLVSRHVSDALTGAVMVTLATTCTPSAVFTTVHFISNILCISLLTTSRLVDHKKGSNHLKNGSICMRIRTN